MPFAVLKMSLPCLIESCYDDTYIINNLITLPFTGSSVPVDETKIFLCVLHTYVERERNTVRVHDIVIVDESLVKRPIRVYCTVVLLIMILIGGIVGAVLLSGKSDTSGNTESPDATFDDPTTNPTINVLLSTNLTASPTEENLYDRPTPEDCLAIANGTTLDGQQDMTFRSFDIDTDVSLNVGFGITAALLHDLEKKLQAFLAPALVGCSESTKHQVHYCECKCSCRIQK
jgi:hypothetical protein